MTENNENLVAFLKCVPLANWHTVPVVWNEQLRRALSDDLVRLEFGGRLALTDAGKAVAAGKMMVR